MAKNYTYDIVVVGGGPAGSSAAWAAAKQGVRVALLETEEAIAEHVRTSGVTWMDEVKSFGIPADLYNPIKNFGFVSSNNEAMVRNPEPKAVVLDVRRTYQFLACQAAEEGTDIFLKTNVLGPLTNDEGKISGVIASSIEGEVTFNSKLVIDASGFHSVIGKKMNLAPDWKKFGVGVEYEAYAENVDPETWYLMVGEKYSPAGYAWIFPLGKNRIRIGVGINKPDSEINPVERLLELLEKKPGPISKLGRISPIEFHYGLIPNEGVRKTTITDNLILVGDSAGQANPLVLEGIRYAIQFGRIAGEVGANAVKQGDTSVKQLKPYENAWKKAIESKVKAAGKVQERWLGLTDEQWDEEIETIKGLTWEEFLDFFRADFTVSNMIRLAVHHPQQTVRQLFGTVKNALGL